MKLPNYVHYMVDVQLVDSFALASMIPGNVIRETVTFEQRWAFVLSYIPASLAGPGGFAVDFDHI